MTAGGLHWTQEQFDEYQARQRGGRGTQPAAGEDLLADDGLERSLQEKIESYCMEHGFYCFHDRSRRKNEPGHPDLVIACRGGRVLWLELKSKTGRLRPEQQRVRDLLLFCGHEWHLLRSYRQFMQIIAEGEK